MIRRLFGAAIGSAVAAGAAAAYYSRRVTVSESGAAPGTLLRKHADSNPALAGSADTVSLVVPGRVDVESFMRAFLLSPVFKAERAILPASTTDEQAVEFAAGSKDKFALWKNHERTDSEILTVWDESGAMGATWFRVVPQPDGNSRLEFGSAIGCSEDQDDWTDQYLMPILIPIHILYSKLLLQSAADKLLSFAAAEPRA